jgi:uncharacterized membrane protein
MLLPFCTEMTCLLGVALLLSALLALAMLLLLPVFLPALAIDGLFGSWSSTSVALLTGSLPWLLPLELFIIVGLATVGTLLALKPQMSMQCLQGL